MKLEELKKNPEWAGSYQVIAIINDIRIILLSFKLNGWSDYGRQNLVAIDTNENIVWIADPPSFGYQLNCFENFSYENGKLKGWYGGSILVEVDSITGKILREQFIW